MNVTWLLLVFVPVAAGIVVQVWAFTVPGRGIIEWPWWKHAAWVLVLAFVAGTVHDLNERYWPADPPRPAAAQPPGGRGAAP